MTQVLDPILLPGRPATVSSFKSHAVSVLTLPLPVCLLGWPFADLWETGSPGAGA